MFIHKCSDLIYKTISFEIKHGLFLKQAALTDKDFFPAQIISFLQYKPKRMKKIILSIISGITAAAAFAQNVGIGTDNPANKLEVVAAVTDGANAVIYSTNTGTAGSAISGTSNAVNSFGVQGTSNFGTGIYAYSNSYIGVSAGAVTGTSVYASSVSGYGLQVSGNVKLSGGNTNPSTGAVLTSDASGNAVWKPKKIGFFAKAAANSSIPVSVFRKVEFSTEEFDHQDNFVNYTGTTNTASSVFTAPVAGIYHFSSSVLFESADDINSGQIRLVKNASGTVLANYEALSGNTAAGARFVSLEINGDFHLNANDKVWIEVAQRNTTSDVIGLNHAADRGRFSGYLIVAD